MTDNKLRRPNESEARGLGIMLLLIGLIIWTFASKGFVGGLTYLFAVVLLLAGLNVGIWAFGKIVGKDD